MQVAIIVAVVVALVALGAIAWYVTSTRKRTGELRNRFGTEYDREVAQLGNRRRAESELSDREKRVERLDIRPLPDTQRQEYTDRWRAVQARFVDDPKGAVRDADGLVEDVMTARGYPMGEWEQRANDVSVDHPQVVAHYRAARGTFDSIENGDSDTEFLRQAMVHYRALFDELVVPETAGARR